ncbi:hypothetical protein TRSC58_05568 [Trypanosoma rangeli SC58]|uniref:Uncharacterized protein n=1 Tax=Trypanosoma rangeli SC58 TaxID=429131 RepID=A0A061IVP3_TRYRA|nr:hypothetical protein TRSC58_05568 [Trypanosoma rangeli SC58]
MENEELKVRLVRSGAHDDGRHCGGSGGSSRSRSAASRSSGDKPHGTNDDTALVLHWLRTVAPMPPTAQGHGSAWQSRVAEVLRRAHAAVCFLEKQHEEDSNRLSRCYETIKQLQEESKRRNGRPAKRGNKPHEDGGGDEEEGGAPMMADLVLQENRALKKRLKMLQALMEKERVAYESLRFAPSGVLLGDDAAATTTTTNGDDAASGGSIGGAQVTVTAYEQLKSQYEELRCAFNSLQKERLRRGGV